MSESSPIEREAEVLGVPLAADAPVVREAPKERSLRARTMSGAIWTMGGYGLSQVLRLGANVVVSRVIPPQAYGVVTLVNTVIQGLQMFSDVGLGPNIIQHPRGGEPAFLRTAYTVQAIRGVVIWILAAALAYPFSLIYKEHALTVVIPVAALSALIAGFFSTSLFTLRRRISLGKITLLELGTQVLGLAVMIAWAYVSPTVWSLVAGGLVASVVKLWLSHTLLRDHRDGFGIEKEALRSILHFGGWVFLSTILGFFAGKGDALIVGKLISMEDLGIFGLANMLTKLAVEVVLNIGGSVIFPAYSHAKNTGGDFLRVFKGARFALCAGGLVLVTGLAVCGPDFIRLLWTKPVWHRAAEYVPLLCLASVFQVLEVTSGQALFARGAVKYIALGNAVKMVGLGALIPLGFYNPFGWSWLGGIEGAILCIAASDLMRYLVSATCAQLEGLPVFRFDAAFVLAVGAVYFVATRVAQWASGAAPGEASFVRFAVGGAIVVAAFAVPLLRSARLMRGAR